MGIWAMDRHISKLLMNTEGATDKVSHFFSGAEVNLKQKLFLNIMFYLFRVAFSRLDFVLDKDNHSDN
jgi:hypothetical protein